MELVCFSNGEHCILRINAWVAKKHLYFQLSNTRWGLFVCLLINALCEDHGATCTTANLWPPAPSPPSPHIGSLCRTVPAVQRLIMCLMGAATVPPASVPWGGGSVHVAGGRDRLPSQPPIIRSGRSSHSALLALAHLGAAWGAAWEAAVLTQWQRKMSKKEGGVWQPGGRDECLSC